MKRQLPFIGGSLVLSACNSHMVTIVDKVTDSDIVNYCAEQTKCSSELTEDAYLFYCVDSIKDEQHEAKSLGCEDEFNDLLACAIKEAPERSCASDFEEYDDYADYQEDLYEEYYDNDFACEDEYEDLNTCLNDFKGIDEDAGYSYYEY